VGSWHRGISLFSPLIDGGGELIDQIDLLVGEIVEF
jgi:hypothetical protein